MSRPLTDALNESNPNKLPNGAHDVLLGSALGKNSVQFGVFTVAGDLAILSAGLKAEAGISVFVTAGGSTGYFTQAAQESTPGAGTYAVNANGDIEFAAADAVTDAEISWAPVEGDTITETIPVAASVGTFLQARSGRKILSASVVTGVTPGAALTSIARGGIPAAGEVAIDDAGTTATFNAANVVAGTVSVTYLAAPGVGTGVSDSLATRLAAGVDY